MYWVVNKVMNKISISFYAYNDHNFLDHSVE